MQAQNRQGEQAGQRLSFREKAGYGIGDLGFNLYWANISAFLLIFYTDVMGLGAAAVGTMILVTKIIDAATDPLMGALADRTSTRWGRFRPWMLWGALPLAVAGVLTWTVPGLEGGGRLLWAYATFSLMMLAYTVLAMPYSALSGVMTADSQQRTTLISFRFIAAFAGTTVVNWLTPDLVRWLGGGDDVALTQQRAPGGFAGQRRAGGKVAAVGRRVEGFGLEIHQFGVVAAQVGAGRQR